jgi:hypothetical protein
MIEEKNILPEKSKEENSPPDIQVRKSEILEQ